MAIAKLLLSLIMVVIHHYAMTAPNYQPPTDQLREQHGLERVIPHIIALIRTGMWSWWFLQGLVLFALSDYCPPALARPFLHFLRLPPSATENLTALTPTFLPGALLSIAGAALRLHCFHVLGPRFTFELSIRPSHSLVTHGVYSIVRHPSYAGILALIMGWLLCVLDRRGSVVVNVCAGWIRAWSSGTGTGTGTGGEGGEDAVGAVLMGVWAVALGIFAVVARTRMDREDAMLEKNFGEAWWAWAKRVPYRMVPGVY